MRVVLIDFYAVSFIAAMVFMSATSSLNGQTVDRQAGLGESGLVAVICEFGMAATYAVLRSEFSQSFSFICLSAMRLKYFW